MAKYQILYWQHIPLGVRAIDEQGPVRQTLSGRFEEALKRTSEDYKQVLHSSELKWTPEQERPGTAAELVAAVMSDLEENWDEAMARDLYARGELFTGWFT
jgi:hypothetical protein